MTSIPLPDTVVALSSAAGGLRGIVRLSGPRARPLAAAVCRPAGAAAGRAPGGDLGPSRRLIPVTWRLPDGGAPVPAALAWMPAPRSYTGEDVVEIHLPGAAPLLRALVGALVAAGARPAEPGEFTRRAFRNGRLDLAQAESVMALIGAADRAALAGARAGLAGALSRPCRNLELDLEALSADAEAVLDFPDEDVEPAVPEEVAGRAERLAGAVEAVASGARDGTPWRPGAIVLLYGPRNAGKSSLFNALAGGPRALVSPAPGTTRDLLEAELALEGLALRLVDAAGLPGPGAPPLPAPEAEGVARLRRLAGEADLLVVVLDGSDPAGAGGEGARMLEGRRGVVALNKADRGAALAAAAVAPGGDPGRVVRVSARTGEGLDRLRAALAAEARRGSADGAGERLALTARQAAALGRAASALRRAAGAARDGPGLAFAADDLREARAALGEVTGRGTAEDLLDAVFARFCIGK